MKKLKKFSVLAVFVLLAASLNLVHAQTNSDPVIAVEPTAMNVLYLGVDNPVTIAVAGVPASELKVAVSHGIIKGNTGNYEVRPGKTGNLTFTIAHGEKRLGTKEFRVLAVPDPVTVLRGAGGSHMMKAGKETMPKSKLVQLKSLGADLHDFLFDVEFKVISFQMSTEMNGMSKILTSEDANITREMQGQISSAMPGQTIIFEEIKAIGPDGKTRTLQPVKVKVM